MRLISFTFAATALFLSACVPGVPTKGAFIPYDQVIAETAGLPFECSSYDMASDSCESIGSSRLSGSSVEGEGRAVLSTNPPVSVTIAARGRLVEGRVCFSPEDATITFQGLPDRQSAEFYAGAMEAEIEALGGICTAYFRTGQPGVYVTETRDASGALIPEGTDVSSFFPNEKRLRVPQF